MMKTKIYSIAIFAFAFASYNAQVGINIPDPTATMDITAKSATGTSTQVDGLLIPRVDRQRASSMTNVPTSTLIYVNEIATGTLTGTTQDVDAVGYYFFNGSKWQKLNPAPVAQVDDWHLIGNAGTTEVATALGLAITAGNFIGTADDKILSFGVNKKLTGRMLNDGSFIGGGSATESPASPFTTKFSWGNNNIINTTATGSSMILGSSNTANASGFNLALGKSNKTLGATGYIVGESNETYNASAYGYNNVVSGDTSIATGNYNRIGPFNAGATSSKFNSNFIFGDGNAIENNVNTYYNTLIGRANGLEVAGINNTILGYTNRIRSNSAVTGSYDSNVFLSSTANIAGSNNSGLGQNITVSGNRNIALGNNNNTSILGDNSVMIGYGTIGSNTGRVNGVYALGAEIATGSSSSLGVDQYIFGKKIGISTSSRTLSLGFNSLSSGNTFLAPDISNSNFHYNNNHIFRSGGDAGSKTKVFVNVPTGDINSDSSIADIIVPQGIRYMPVTSQPTCGSGNAGLIIFYTPTSSTTDKMQVCARVSGTYGWRDLN